ncbi:MAG TPA: enolase C-terminal domain-like protein [Gaiellaceae bacterium]|nr:enolase C-terminal domain-like protein [Gaiellaceae bacterium]
MAMKPRIVRAVTYDIRFPTSRSGAGSDAMNPDPDYSAAYVALETDDPSGLTGHGLTFTIGRGTEVCVAAIEALAPHVVGATVDELVADLGGLWRRLVTDTQLRWLGPEKGVIHLATAAIVNAVWDLYAKTEEKPLWKLLVDLPPERLVASIDFRYIKDALTPDEALTILRRNEATKGEREQTLLAEGFPAYTTSAGWLGYSEDSLPQRARDALAEGFTHLKLKVGGDLETDLRRARLVRDAIGPDYRLSLDANQAWGVEQAIDAIRTLSEVDPWWIEEPTSPDDVLGHRRIREAVAPVRIATGEHVQNRVVFKQLLQLGAIDVCQLDCCRLGGVNEVLAVVLLAAKFGVPICPHAGGVGLCEYAQHVSMFDYVAVGATLDDRVCEFVDHLHEHFVDPVRVVGGRYLAPTTPGYSIEIRPESLSEFAFPDGTSWWKEEEVPA